MRAVSERAVCFWFHESSERASSMFLVSWEQWASEQYVLYFMRAGSERAVCFFISWEQWASEQYVLYFMRAGSERAVRFVLHWEESGASGFFFRSYKAVSERAVFFSFLRSCERASGFFFVPTEQGASERYVLYYMRAESGASRKSKLASLQLTWHTKPFPWSLLVWCIVLRHID